MRFGPCAVIVTANEFLVFIRIVSDEMDCVGRKLAEFHDCSVQRKRQSGDVWSGRPPRATGSRRIGQGVIAADA